MAMLNSGVVDVGIALIYVFILVSVLVSAVNELISGLLKQRAKALHRGIGELLQSTELRNQLYNHPLIKTLAPPTSALSGLFTTKVIGRQKDEPTKAGGQAEASAGSNGVKSSPLTAKQGPSYIPKQAFSLALLDLLKGTELTAVIRVLDEVTQGLRARPEARADLGAKLQAVVDKIPANKIDAAILGRLQAVVGEIAQGQKPVAEVLASLEDLRRSVPLQLTSLMEAQADMFSPDLATVVRLLASEGPASVEQLRTKLEGWFDAGMERVAGWYKRWTQAWQLAIGLVLAFFLNINIATIGVSLWTDIPLRNAIVAEAEKFAKNPPPGLWVTKPGEKSGDFALSVTAPLLNDAKNDRVRVAVELPRPAEKQLAVSITSKDSNLRLDQNQIMIEAGSATGEVGGQVDALPVVATLDASVVGATPPRKASRTVEIVSDPGTRIAKTRELLAGTMLPIGWSGGFAPTATMIPGWLLTAIGASFGAPFWFDLLNRVVQLRSGGRKPEDVKKAEGAKKAEKKDAADG